MGINPFNNMNNKDNSFGYNITNYIMIFLLVIFVWQMMFPGMYRSMAAQPEEVVIEYAADKLYDKLSDSEEDIGKYKADLMSYDNSVFTIRKIVDDHSSSKYRFVVKIKSGDYKIITVDENIVNMYILSNKDSQPYAIMEFTAKNSDNPKRVDLYLSTNYHIDVENDNNSIHEDYT